MFSKNLSFSLFKILISNIFSISDFFAGFKKGIKNVIKNIFIILLIIYCFGAFGFMYVSSMKNYCNIFSKSDAPDAFTILILLSSLIIIMFFGFISAATNYYTGTGEEQFLSMPLSSKNIFTAKFFVTFVTDALLGILIFSVSSVIYGVSQHLYTNPLFYLGFIVSGILVAIISVFVIYVLLVFILTIFPALRKRNILTSIASVFIIAFALFYSLFNAKATTALLENQNEMLMPVINVFVDIYNSSSILRFFSSAIKGNVVAIFVMIAICFVILFVLMPMLSELYMKSLNGFSDVKAKKLNTEQIHQVVNKETKLISVNAALLHRDIKTVFREPSFFANGPLMVFLFPIILVFSFSVGFFVEEEHSIEQIIFQIRDFWFNSSPQFLQNVKYYILLGMTGFSLFIGNSSSIAVTSFSREGKSLYVLKSLPVESEDIAKVKMWHALIYVLIANIETSVIFIALVLILGLPLAVFEIIELIATMFITSVAISFTLIFIDMFFDTVNPKLNWENPIAAFKQNVNSLLAILLAMGIIAIFVASCIFLPKSNKTFYGWTIIFVAIDAVLGNAYFRYAKKKIPQM